MYKFKAYSVQCAIALKSTMHIAQCTLNNVWFTVYCAGIINSTV